MASSAQLVETISSATGVPLPTVVDIDRRLVKRKLRAKTGRGLNAAQMTPLDAARLLTAVLGSAQANSSAEAVERYAQTQPDMMLSSDELFGATGINDLATLPERQSFVDGLTALIASAASGSIAKLMTESKSGWEPHIEIFAFTRATRGRIRVAGLPNGLTAVVEYVLAQKPTARAKKRDNAEDTQGDLEQSRRITERTILPIAALLPVESRDE